MPQKPKCSDEEFIKIWKQLGSCDRVSAAMGIARQWASKRRRDIEKKYNIRLLTIDALGRPSIDQSMLVADDRVEVKLKISDGVIIVAGDQHYHPESIPVMHRAYVHLSEKLKPFAQIWNGDALDFPSISRFASIGWEKNPTVAEEIATVRDRSNEILKASPNSKRIWNAGNHDLRFETRLASVASEFRNVDGIHLKDHFPEWTPAWFVTINGGEPSHTEIRHREKGGIHAGYGNAVSSGVNIVTGHDHRADVVPYNDRRGRRYGVRHGMSADSPRDPQFVNYLEGRTANWQAAIAVLTYRDGVLLMPELALRLDDEHFEFRGGVIRV